MRRAPRASGLSNSIQDRLGNRCKIGSPWDKEEVNAVTHGNPLEHIAVLLIEEAKNVGTPLRSVWLYSTGLVMVIEVSQDLIPSVLWSSNDRDMALPVYVTIVGPGGMRVAELLPEHPDKLMPVN